MDLQLTENILDQSEEKDQKAFESIEDFFKLNYQGNWTFTKYKGSTSIISGGKVEHIGSNEKSLLKFSQMVGKYFSVSRAQLPYILLISYNKKARHYFVPQIIEGIQVYNSGIQLSVDQNTNSVFQVNSTLKKIKTIDDSMNVDQIHAWEIVSSFFGDDSVTKLESSFKPVIFSDQGVSGGEFAWVFKIKVHAQKAEQRTIVIGASTGFMLANIENVIH